MKQKFLTGLILLVFPFIIFAQEIQETQESDSLKAALKDRQLANKLYNESLELFNENKYTESITMINKAIALNPEFAKAYFNRAGIRLRLSSTDEAIEDYNKVMELEPNPTIYTGRAYAYIIKKEYQKAIEDLSIAINDNPDYAEAYYYRGCVYVEQEKYSQALTDFDNKFLIISPANKAWVFIFCT